MTRICPVTLLCILHHRKKIKHLLAQKNISRKTVSAPWCFWLEWKKTQMYQTHWGRDLLLEQKDTKKPCITLHRLEICCVHMSRWGFFIFMLQTGNGNSQRFVFSLVYMSQAKWSFFPQKGKCVRIVLIFNFPFFWQGVKAETSVFFCHFEADFFSGWGFSAKKKKKKEKWSNF